MTLGALPLVDMLKETVLRTRCLDTVASVTTGGGLRPHVLAGRLLLAIYAYGTNTGTALSRPAAGRRRAASYHGLQTTLYSA